MSPLVFFLVTLGITIGAAALDVWLRRRHRRLLRHLARQWQMHFSPDDRFRLAARIIPSFPIPGAADVIVTDVIYGSEEHHYRYLMTACYTTGVLHSKKRRCRACAMRESKTPGARGDDDFSLPVFAPENLPLMEQYRKLYDADVAPRAAARTATTTTTAAQAT